MMCIFLFEFHNLEIFICYSGWDKIYISKEEDTMSWQESLRNSVRTAEELCQIMGAGPEELER